MTALRDRLNESLKAALLEQDEVAISTIRLVLAALKDRDIAERGKGNVSGLDDSEIAALLQSMIKQRRESITVYQQAGRTDLAEREAHEIDVIEQFRPPQIRGDHMNQAIAAVVEEVGATSLKEMGQVMAILKQRYGGRMDFTKASAAVRQRLN